MRLGIVGSRRRNEERDKAIVRAIILELKPSLIVSGGCPKGADRFAEELAAELDIPIKVYYPDLEGCRSKIDFTKAYHARNKIIAEKKIVKPKVIV